MNVYLRLLEAEGFSKTEKEIAEYITKNHREIVNMSIQELANNTYTSTTTIIRFCKKLGFNGYREFKVQFSQDLHAYLLSNHKIDLNSPFTGKESFEHVAHNMAYLTKRTIELCQITLDFDEISAIVKQILLAENIIAIGVSDTFIRIIDFQNKMIKINQFVRISHFQPDQAYLCTCATENDIAILVSYSGKTPEVINEAKILKKRNVPIVAITSDKHSPLAKYSNYMMLLPNEENKLIANYSFASQIAIEYALNALYACIYNVNFEQNKQHILSNRQNYLHPDK
ncbi:MurR/RpiR family transcriptional regulator [Erysipelotrichaceae bacterium HCN-30851]